MASKSVLDHAKAFLCWDKFPDLSIQLVELGGAVAYFYPPTNQRASIVVFYKSHSNNFQEPLFLLFHEIGHFLQFCEFKKRRSLRKYRTLMEAVEGQEKVAFEEQAWKLGQEVLSEFLQHEGLQDEGLLGEYVSYSQRCVDTYARKSIKSC